MFSFLKESNIKICSVSLFFCRAKVETVTVKRLVLLFSHWRRVKTISTSLSITHIGIFLRLWRRILSDLKLGLFEDWRSSFCLQARVILRFTNFEFSSSLIFCPFLLALILAYSFSNCWGVCDWFVKSQKEAQGLLQSGFCWKWRWITTLLLFGFQHMQNV